ncbi:GtrA family protein [Xanthobacteraceae bacterium Astr-EGSB]|uniref:GtrA family protein n=1 Tax=Astrobacterium formosum TaxID=3069710 RepID=UPI0027B3F701|nr:GtrA family protein [Xanthobacteraceae bacterium Astr-EGSB]
MRPIVEARPGQVGRFIRFIFVGLGNTVFGYAMFVALFWATGSETLAVIGANILGVLFNSVTTGKLVFGQNGGARFIPFCLGYVFVLVLNLALLKLATWYSIPPLWAQAVLLPVMAVTSFLINDLIVFKVR